MVAVGQTITVVNKSGKVVSNSKHIVNVFKEARSAYRERKAELRAAREDEAERLRLAAEQKKKQKQQRLDDGASVASSRSTRSHASSRRHSYERVNGRRPTASRRGSGTHSSHQSKPAMERGYSDSFFESANGTRHPRAQRSPTSPLRHSQDVDTQVQRHELSRRRSANDGLTVTTIRRKPVAAHDSNIDMDLAYGELPPPLPARRGDEEQELRLKMTTLQKMLEEANCLQHSAQATIKNLESNPDAMAAVALTMAEISSLASKMAPGALTSLKAAFPAVIALLLSPEFLIAAGVGVGITVVALGGYKIIKRIQQRKEKAGDGDKTVTTEEVDENDDNDDELETVDGDLDRIEQWRRGIQPVQAEALGSSVEGEYATPAAAKQLRAEGALESKKETKKRKEAAAKKDKRKDKSSKPKDDASKKSKAKDDERSKAKDDQKSAKDKDAKRVKAATESGSTFHKLFSSKKDKEVVGDYV